MKILTLLLVYLGYISWANALSMAVSDPTTQRVTHCGFYINDAVVPLVMPAQPTLSGKRCYLDITTFSAGTYTISATYFKGSTESSHSNTVTITLPLVFDPNMVVPSNIRPILIH